MSESDPELIRRARQGDGRAIRELYDRHAPRVYAVVRRIAADDATAEDYAQEAWIKAIRALSDFRGDARFSSWLHRIAVNAALQGVRKAKTRRRRRVPMPETLPVEPARRDALLRERLEEAVERLPEGMRTVLVLHDVEGYTHAEIGEMLDVATGTSKSQLYKARAKMRELLRVDGDGSAPSERSTASEDVGIAEGSAGSGDSTRSGGMEACAT